MMAEFFHSFVDVLGNGNSGKAVLNFQFSRLIDLHQYDEEL